MRTIKVVDARTEAQTLHDRRTAREEAKEGARGIFDVRSRGRVRRVKEMRFSERDLEALFATIYERGMLHGRVAQQQDEHVRKAG